MSGANVPSDALTPGEADHAPALTNFVPLEETRREGPRSLRRAGEQLAELLLEVGDRPPLPHDGVIYQKKGI